MTFSIEEGLFPRRSVKVASSYLVHVCAGVLVELVAGGEDDECDLAVAEHGQLVRFLHHAELPLVEGHLRERENSLNLRFRHTISTIVVILDEVRPKIKCHI
jgi:hypothetical protein